MTERLWVQHLQSQLNFEYTDSPLNHNWTVYTAGSGTLATVTGSGRPGRVLRATTSQGTGFGIRYPHGDSLDIPMQGLSVWIKDSNYFQFYVRVHGTNGSDYYIMYAPTSGSPYPSGSYAIVPVGTRYRDGTWRELRRDLDADLREVFGVGVEYVKWFCIRGDYDLDDLRLLPVYQQTYDAENRLASVSGAASATFVYDGDGNRVKATFGGTNRRPRFGSSVRATHHHRKEYLLAMVRLNEPG